MPLLLYCDSSRILSKRSRSFGFCSHNTAHSQASPAIHRAFTVSFTSDRNNIYLCWDAVLCQYLTFLSSGGLHNLYGLYMLHMSSWRKPDHENSPRQSWSLWRQEMEWDSLANQGSRFGNREKWDPTDRMRRKQKRAVCPVLYMRYSSNFVKGLKFL